MGKKRYQDTDEIELRLEHNVADHYWLQWRFKEPRKFLFFNIYDKWKTIHYYTGVYGPDDDPNDDMYWYWRGFHLGKNSEVQEYEHIKETIKTKAALFKYFNVKNNIDRYYNDLHKHKLWLDELNGNIKKFTK